MGCKFSNNVIAPDPEGMKKLGHGSPTGTENSSKFKTAVGLNDIIIDKSFRNTFVQYIKEEKRTVEEEVSF